MATITEGQAIPAGKPEKAKGPLVYRQAILTRITHWTWAVALFFLPQLPLALAQMMIGR